MDSTARKCKKSTPLKIQDSSCKQVMTIYVCRKNGRLSRNRSPKTQSSTSSGYVLGKNNLPNREKLERSSLYAHECLLSLSSQAEEEQLCEASREMLSALSSLIDIREEDTFYSAPHS